MIYFVQAASGPIKIGFTDNWTRRKNSLQHGTYEELKKLLVMPGKLEGEQALHRLFSAHRIRGEWFRPAPEVLALIASRMADDIKFAFADAYELRQAERGRRHDAGRKCLRMALVSIGPESVARDLGYSVRVMERLCGPHPMAFMPHDSMLDRVLKIYGESFQAPGARVSSDSNDSARAGEPSSLEVA
jgi:hypothetical protein